jgi:hypothetical protein
MGAAAAGQPTEGANVPPVPPAVATGAETSAATLDKTVQPCAVLTITVVVTITGTPEVQPTQAAAQSGPTHTPTQEPARVAAVASPQPEDDQSHEAGGRPLSETAGWLAVVEPWRPYLPWTERGLALLLAALLGATLIVRRQRRQP